MKRITEYDNITTIAENDVLPIVDVSDTEQASTGSTRKGSIEKIADYLKARVETLSNKTLTSPVLNSPDIDTPDISGGTIDGTDISGGTIASDTNVVEVLKKVYPVGCIYTSTVSTNPNSLFGFGTWSAFGSGKVLVGVDGGDGDFNSVEKTGGAKTVTLTSAQSGLPAHGHTQRFSSGANNNVIGIAQTSSQSSAPGINSTYVTANNTEANAVESHTNLQPYITVYFYKRTA
jgi:hypothetical protein